MSQKRPQMLPEQVHVAIWACTSPNTEVLTTAVFVGEYFESNMSLDTNAVLPDPLMTNDHASGDHHESKAAANASRASIAATGSHRSEHRSTVLLTTAVFLGGYFESNMFLGTYAVLSGPLMTSEQAASDQHESKAASNAFGASIVAMGPHRSKHRSTDYCGLFGWVYRVHHVPRQICITF